MVNNSAAFPALVPRFVCRGVDLAELAGSCIPAEMGSNTPVRGSVLLGHRSVLALGSTQQKDGLRSAVDMQFRENSVYVIFNCR